MGKNKPATGVEDREVRAKDKRATDLNEAGVNAAKENQLEDAIQYFQQAREYAPSDSTIRSNLFYVQGIQQERKGNRQAALKMYADALGAKPDMKVAREAIDDLNQRIRADDEAARQDAEAKRRIQAILNSSDVTAKGVSASGDSKTGLQFMGSKPVNAGNGLDFMNSAAMAHAKILTTPELRQRLAVLRSDVAVTQNALRRLSGAIRVDESQRIEWENETEKATSDAWKQAREMLTDGVLYALDGSLKKQLDSANSEIRNAVDRLIGETDPSRREQLHAAIKVLERERSEIRAAQDKIAETGDAKDVIEVAEWTTSKDDALQKSLEGTYQLMEKTLSDPTLQKALKVGKGYGQALKYGKSILDSAYDVSAELVSIKRISELNKNSDEYLSAVRKLSEHLRFTVKEIQLVENQLNDSKQGAIAHH